MIKFYYNPSPNPMKVALLFEEANIEYDPIPVDPRRGEQFAPWFVEMNPNSKIPVINDNGTVVFDSNAILLYLSQKVGRFLGPDTPQARGELLSWLMFVATGLSPYSGQAVHFRHMTPEPNEYGNRRYQYEVLRHYSVIEQRLATRSYILGSEYSIVDMAAWGWIRMADFVMGEGALEQFPHVGSWFGRINARPAAARAEELRKRHDFKTSWDDDARENMFRFQKAQART